MIRDKHADQQELIDIQPEQDIYVGRSLECNYICSDPLVSSRHLRIRAIIFDEHEADITRRLPPLVYADDLSRNGTYLQRCCQDHPSLEPLEKRRLDGSTLLQQGDRLLVGTSLLIDYMSPNQDGRKGTPPNGLERLNLTQRAELELISDRYHVSPTCLGLGGQGSVYSAIHCKSGQSLACKILDRCAAAESKHHVAKLSRTDLGAQGLRPLSRDNTMQMRKLFREFEVLIDLDHPNIIRLEKAFHSNNNVYIFQELCSGGDLFSYMDTRPDGLDDTQAAIITLQLLKAIDYLHDHEITHRDLKPDNVLMATWSTTTPRIVLTDFGQARRLPGARSVDSVSHLPHQRMVSVVGTIEHAAPEVHRLNPALQSRPGYTKAIDMWSLGTIVFLLLSGHKVFGEPQGSDSHEHYEDRVKRHAARCDLSILNTSGHWYKIGQRPKDFIRNLLVLEESKRLDAKQALDHPWLSHPQYAKELDAIYEHCIKDWRPRRKVFKLIEALPTPHQDVKSPHFSRPDLLATDVLFSSSRHQVRQPTSIQIDGGDSQTPSPISASVQSNDLIENASQLGLSRSQHDCAMSLRFSPRTPQQEGCAGVMPTTSDATEDSCAEDVLMSGSQLDCIQETQLSAAGVSQ